MDVCNVLHSRVFAMSANTSLFRYSLPSIIALCAAMLLPAPGLAEERLVVADVLETPATQSRHAQRSLQLAVTQAGQRLVAVGERGIVQLSDDEGRSWRQASHVPVSVTLTDVEFVSAERGWAVGHSGVLLSSTDGGENWSLVMDGNQAAQIVLQGAQQQLANGAEGAERAVRSAEYLVADGPDKPFLDVTFASPSRGYLIGAYGLALETRDGGQSWQSLVERIPNPRGNHLYQMQIRGQEIVIAGEQGVLFRSLDGGQSFSQLSAPYAGTFFGVLGLQGDGLLVYGLQGNAWRSTDGGGSWQQVDVGQSASLAAGLRLSDGTLLLADESGRLLHGRQDASRFAALAVQSPASITDLLQTADGALVLAGVRGMQRIEQHELDAGVSP